MCPTNFGKTVIMEFLKVGNIVLKGVSMPTIQRGHYKRIHSHHVMSTTDMCHYGSPVSSLFDAPMAVGVPEFQDSHRNEILSRSSGAL